MKKYYIPPKMKGESIFLEECIASASQDDISLGGNGNSSYPEITDQVVDDENYIFEF